MKEKNRNYFVYFLIDPRTDLPFYIGKGQIKDFSNRYYRRIYDHLNFIDINNKLKVKTIKNITNKKLEVKIKTIEPLDEKNALLLEKFYIKKYGRILYEGGVLTNFSKGGKGNSGYKHSKDSKRKQSNRRKEWHKINDNPFKNKKHSKETKLRMSKIQKQINKEGPFKGKRHTKETKLRISEIRKKMGCLLPKNERYKFGKKFENNYFSKAYIFISPDNKSYEVVGKFKLFVKNNNLSLSTCKKFINKGKIPLPKNIIHNRMTQERINTSGWEILLKK